MKPTDDNSNLQMLDSADVMALFKMSKATLWRHVRDGRIPTPVYIGRTPLWHKHTLERWVEGLGVSAPRVPPAQPAARHREIDGFC